MTVTGVDHVQITVPPEMADIAREFYCRLLGLTEAPKPEALAGRGGFWLEAGTFRVHVGVDRPGEMRGGKAHVAYKVTNIAAWRTKLAEAGVEILDGIPLEGYERFEFRDPCGNRVEFLESVS